MTGGESVLQEAERLINGPKRVAYGPAKESFERIAVGWAAILGRAVAPQEVALCMVWLKVCREVNKPDRDNIVDIAGYAGLIENIGG